MAQKNTLRYVILGLLSKEPMAGYDIKKAFEGEIGDFWYSNHSQIYPELSRMEQDGFIIGHEEVVGSKLTKKKYTITEAGKALFNEWLAESLSSLPPTRDEFAMKVYFMDSSEDPLLVALFQEEILRHEEKLDYLQSRWKALFAEKGKEETHFGHALILERAIRREQDLLAWLHEAYKRLPGKNQ
ncbi:MAG: PadR family transcriptional regulator [Megasphaera massiliensis]|uniref:PadR family transcriptional regulator n=1 Tax=Megasphaera massiliensis TaxID=1232428 RepID=UPI002A755356|nr:PadR family transcriptional regulator [Megasphaera massiliensis]MDY2966118.1 PadR family transcriptional regulator [Megasphaera massiliensis]